MSDIKLYNGDCLEIMKTLDFNKLILITPYLECFV